MVHKYQNLWIPLLQVLISGGHSYHPAKASDILREMWSPLHRNGDLTGTAQVPDHIFELGILTPVVVLKLSKHGDQRAAVIFNLGKLVNKCFGSIQLKSNLDFGCAIHMFLWPSFYHSLTGSIAKQLLGSSASLRVVLDQVSPRRMQILVYKSWGRQISTKAIGHALCYLVFLLDKTGTQKFYVLNSAIRVLWTLQIWGTFISNFTISVYVLRRCGFWSIPLSFLARRHAGKVQESNNSGAGAPQNCPLHWGMVKVSHPKRLSVHLSCAVQQGNTTTSFQEMSKTTHSHKQKNKH